MAWGIYFFAYNTAKERYRRRDPAQAKLSPGLHLASAAEAGSIVCLITNPVWVVKTRLQLQKRSLATAAGAAAGAATAAPPAAAAAAAGSAAQAAGAALRAAVGASAASGVPRAVAGAGAGAGPAYRGFVDCFVQVARREGVRGLYKGLLPSLLLVSHGAIQFAVYEELKSAAQGFRGFTHPLGGRRAQGGAPAPPRALTSAEVTACGALSKLVASVSTYPSQVVRSRLQQRMDARALKYTGALDVVRKTLAREGVGGLYKGLLPNVLRVMPQSALTFLVYESVMAQLGGGATPPGT
jgi:solute carrier family 25 folate transporter 32